MAGVLVDDDPTLDAKDRSFPAFWLPFQDVNSHNHAAQWVEQVPSMNKPDGGAGGGDARRVRRARRLVQRELTLLRGRRLLQRGLQRVLHLHQVKSSVRRIEFRDTATT